MITGKIIPGTTITVPTTVYTSSGTNAITTMVLCNTGTPDLTNENTYSINVNVYLVSPSSGGDNATTGNGSLIVSKLRIPAGETVFFSDEKIVLGNGDLVRDGYEIDANHDTGTYPTYTNLLTVTVSTLEV